MADISMCAGKGCSLRLMCYRHRAIPSKYQSYADYDRDGPKTGCISFWPIEGRKDVVPAEEKAL